MKHQLSHARAALRPAIWLAACLILPCLLALTGQIFAADKEAKEPTELAKAVNGKQSAADRLALEEEALTKRFDEFEKLLLQMAERSAGSDPKRAALLRKAFAQSKEQLITEQLKRVTDVLKHDQLATALTDQQQIEQDMQKLLELLLSEQRSDKLKDERERLKQQIRKLKEIINRQIQVQAETEGKGDTAELSKRQDQLAQDTGKLGKEMGGSTGQSSKPTEAKDNSNEKPKGKEPKADKSDKPGEKKADEPAKSAEKPGDKPKAGEPKSGAESKPGDKKPADGESKPSKPGKAPKPGQQGNPMPGQPNQDGETDESASAPPPTETPGRKRLAAAEQKMEDARKKLEKAEREGATKDQEEAVRELEQAKAELEEILRQLRDEEVERVLAQLEARFRKMLELQQEVYEGTKRVDRVPAANRGRSDEIEAGRLSRKESMIVVEAEKALGLLHDEGSAVAFPEAVEQMREDMEQVVARLAQAKVDLQTQGLEEDIIAGLEEMIASLQKAQQDKEKQKDQQQQGGGDGGDPPLVDKLSELKMIRSLQMRVNTRTKRYSRLVQGDLGQGEAPDLLEALRRLAEREERIYRTTRDIVIGKNE